MAVIAGGGLSPLMLEAELALAQVDVAIVERRENQDLASVRAGGLHARTIEIFDQRGVADRFLSQGKTGQFAGFSFIPLDLSDFPTRHNYVLALRQKQIERIMADWVDELAVKFYRGREVTGFAQDDTASTSSCRTADRCVRSISPGATELAVECGFYDQARFANEFRSFSGIDLTTYTATSSRL
jgi:2-polyprenyl-6-methoxyphenol hydroxylase-like FAD-dependent oxidoreductase